MNKKFCDICKKELNGYNEEVRANYGWKLTSHVFCLFCGKPVLNFLKRNRFIDKEDLAKLGSLQKKVEK